MAMPRRKLSSARPTTRKPRHNKNIPVPIPHQTSVPSTEPGFVFNLCSCDGVCELPKQSVLKTDTPERVSQAQLLARIAISLRLFFGLPSFSIPTAMWWSHFVNLLGHSWDAMVRATGTTTLGFIIWTLALTAVGWAATVAVRWIELKRENTTSPFEKALLSSRLPGIFLAGGVFVLVLVVFWFFLALTVYRDHQSLVAENKKLADRNVTLSAELNWRKHNISTTDAVFPNIIYLLQAFQVYRGYIKGAPCVIWITAPSDSLPLASTVAQFSNSVSGCSTFGPFPSGNPDLDEDVMDGMVPSVIVLHAPRDDRAAGELEMRLGNLIQTRRSYTPPKTPKPRLYQSLHQYTESFIWLQFGTNTKWNSER